MRVIAGTAKRINLRTLDGLDTRPTLDRQKETLFNVIQFDIPGSNTLDLFAGSGALGIEALSRGGAKAYFVEQNGEAFEVIKENLIKTHLKERSVVMLGEAIQALPKLKNEKFDLIFLDPPYHSGLETKAIQKIMELDLLNDYGTIIVESAKETDLSMIIQYGLEVDTEKTFKISKLTFFKKHE